MKLKYLFFYLFVLFTVGISTVFGTCTVSTTIKDIVCQNQPYTQNGFNISSANTNTLGISKFQQTTISSQGCDSTTTLFLTVSSTTGITLNDTICQNQTYKNYGFNLPAQTTAGIQTLTVPRIACNDTLKVLVSMTLNLFVFPTPKASITVAAGDSAICKNSSITLQAVATADSFSFNIPPQVAIGDILCTDGSILKPNTYSTSGKTAQGVVFYVDSTGLHGWAANLQNQSTGGVNWGTGTGANSIVTGLPVVTNNRSVITDLDGYGNTQKIRAFGTPATHPAAYAVDFPNGWYLAAAGQLRILYGTIQVINPSLVIAGGTPFETNKNGMTAVWFMWSSSQNSATQAWHVYMSGNVSMSGKSDSSRRFIRSIRNF